MKHAYHCVYDHPSTSIYEQMLARGRWSDCELDMLVRSNALFDAARLRDYSNEIDKSIGEQVAERRSNQLRLDMLRRMRELALSALGVEAGE